MVATVEIVELNSTAATQTAKSTSTIRFKNADDATVDTNNRLVIPGSTGQRDYSFEKWVRLRIDTAPDTDITNIETYSDGSNTFGSGVKLWYWTATAFDSANGPQEPSTANDPPHLTGSTVNGTDFFTATSGSPVTLSTASHTSTGEVGDHLILVMEVESSATQGTLTAETLTISYDET